MGFPRMEFTDWGLWLERQAQKGEQIDIVGVQIGDQPWGSGSQQAVTECLNPIVTVPVDAVHDMRDEFGHVILRIREDQLIEAFDDAGITMFLYAERAIMARDPEGGPPKAMCYVNAGELAETVHLYDNPEIARLELEFHLEIARAAEVVVKIGTDPAYVTPGMLAQDIDRHNADDDAHKGLFDAIRAWVLERIGEVVEALGSLGEALTRHTSARNNPHQVQFSQILGADGVVAVENGGTGSQYHQVYYWPLSSGHLWCTINGYEMKYWGRVAGLGVIGGRSAVIGLPIPFGSAQYWANAEVWNSNNTLASHEATVTSKSTNSVTVFFNGASGQDIDVDFCCIGLAAPLNNIPNRPGAPAFYPPLSHQTDPPPVVENPAGASVGYPFSASGNWQPTGDGQFSLHVPVGNVDTFGAVVDVTTPNGESFACGHALDNGVVTITADEPADGIVTVTEAILAP